MTLLFIAANVSIENNTLCSALLFNLVLITNLELTRRQVGQGHASIMSATLHIICAVKWFSSSSHLTRMYEAKHPCSHLRRKYAAKYHSKLRVFFIYSRCLDSLPHMWKNSRKQEIWKKTRWNVLLFVYCITKAFNRSSNDYKRFALLFERLFYGSLPTFYRLWGFGFR